MEAHKNGKEVSPTGSLMLERAEKVARNKEERTENGWRAGGECNI